MSAIRDVKIVQMSRHFLYMPLYYAEARRWFSLLPPDIKLKVTSVSDPKDEVAFERLMKERDETWFAVCDPIWIRDAKADSAVAPVLLASLVVNTAFWAVNHGKYQAKDVDDLKRYEKIITFGSGTTAWAIASSLLDGRDATDVCVSVDPPNELTLLRESEAGTLALTPNILDVRRLMRDYKDVYSIELELGRTPEFGNALVTGLLSRRDVVDHEPETVKAVVQALVRATLACRTLNPDLMATAQAAFGEGEDVTGAMEAANQSELFAGALTPTLSTWMNRCRIQTAADDEVWDDKARGVAQEAFDSRVEPYRHIVEHEYERLLAPLLKRQAEEPVTRQLVLLLIAATIGLAARAFGGVSAAVVSELMLIGVPFVGGLVLARALQLVPRSRIANLYWASWLVITAVVTVIALGRLSAWAINGLTVMLTLATTVVLGIVVDHQKREK